MSTKLPRPGVTRRAFIGVAGSALVLPGVAAGQAPPRPKYKVRPNIAALRPDSPVLKDYATAVRVMKGRDPKDPTSWAFQGGIHGLPGAAGCRHNNWHFLAWHRAYLLDFEAICRAACGNPEFVLPYWDWSADRSLPPAFAHPRSPLYYPGRVVSPKAPGVDVTRFNKVAVDRALRARSFETYGGLPNSGGPAESGAHNAVHNYVGGPRGMADARFAALDPVFWPHHANVDRLWTEWALGHGDQTPVDKAYTDARFSFYGPTGAPVTRAAGDLGSTYVLGYRYDTQPPAPVVRGVAMFAARLDAPAGAAASGALADVVTPASPRTITLAAAGAPKVFATQFGAAPPMLPVPPRPPELRVQLNGVAPSSTSDVSLRVFLNEAGATAATPTTDPAFVGAVSFFGSPGGGGHANHGGGHPAAASFVLDATDSAAALQAAGRYAPGKPLTVTLVAVPEGGAAADKVSVTVTSASVQVFD